MVKLFKDDQPLETLVAARRYVKVFRFIPDSPPIYGILLAAGEGLVLLHNENDFLLDGYSVIRRHDISRLAADKAVAWHEKLLAAEGVAAKAGMDASLPLGNWRELFAGLRKLGKCVIVQCEHQGLFAVGQIARVGARSLSLRQFDTLGRWLDRPTPVHYERITLVQFDTRYINVFSRHLQVNSRRGK